MIEEHSRCILYLVHPETERFGVTDLKRLGSRCRQSAEDRLGGI